MNDELLIKATVSKLALHPASFSAHAKEIIRDMLAKVNGAHQGAMVAQRHSLAAESDKLIQELAETRRAATEAIGEEAAKHARLTAEQSVMRNSVVEACIKLPNVAEYIATLERRSEVAESLKEGWEKRTREAWEAGFRLCRAYGDNHIHFQGEQKESAWKRFNESGAND